MFAFTRTKKIRQKRKMLEHIFTQNLILVGKAPALRKSPFAKRLPMFLGVLVFISAFFSTDVGGLRIRQGLGMFSNTSERQSREYFAKGSLQSEIPIAATLLNHEDTNLNIQSPEDQSDMRAYANMLSENTVSIKKIFGLDVKTIIIDAGHGGEDAGAIGSLGTKEKDITLDIARILKKRLEASGQLRVLLTRSDDTYIALKERTVTANESGADLFISIHANSLPGRSINIIETFYFGASTNSTEMKLAEKENEGSGFSFSDYNQLIKNFSITMKLQESRLLAQKIQQHLFQSMHTVNKEVQDFGVKRAPFVVLLGAEMPSVLVEISCLSNRDEELRLRDPEYRETIAGYIETGVIKYLQSRSTDYDTKRAEWDIR